MSTIQMPSIMAYHPEIHVQNDGEHHIIKMVVPEFATDQQLLKSLATDLKAKTVGDVVQALKSTAQAVTDSKVFKPTVVETTNVVPLQVVGKKVWGWDEVI